MRNNRKIVLILILALAIGFAGISTMLRIGGTTKVGFDQASFEADIIFTKSVLDEEDVSDATIIDAGKKIRFETKKLTTVGESTVLDYTVTNKSNQYGARGHVKTFEYDPEYIRVENTPNDFDLLPQSNSLGKLTITLIKPLLEDKETEVIIEIEVDPIDPGDVITTTTTETTTTTTEEIDDGKTKYDLVIDPDGGVYNGSSEIINTKVVENTEITLDKVTKEGYIFSHWEVNEEILKTEEITITGNTTIKAVWIPISEAVARINETYYLSIQSAFDAAKTNDEVVLLKDTEEVATNKKDIVFNLNTYKVTGSIANTGVLRIDNGEIENTNGSAINNTGTLTIGNNEGTVSITSPSIIGTDIGIEQKGTLNFYDGVVEGKIGINGDVAKTPEEYFVFVDHNDLKDTQKVYLVKELTRAVVKTITNGTVYYFNLQDGINSSSLTGYKIYAIRDFEAPYELNVKEGESITFDITGYTVELGNAITNTGTLTLIDSGDEKGELKPSVAITNNSVLNINNISISQTTDAQVIINKKDINITNSTLTGKGGNALELMGEATLNMDDGSYLKSNQWSLYLHDIDTTISSGNIEGIYIETTASLTLEGGYFTRSDNRATINALGNLTINKGLIENTSINSRSYAIYSGNNSSTKKVIINGGEIRGDGINNTVYIQYGYFEMNGGIIKSVSNNYSDPVLVMSSGNYEINGGIIYMPLSRYSSDAAVYLSGTGTINNLEIHSKTSGINLSSGTVTINNINIVECARTGISNSAILTINDGTIKGSIGINNSGSSVTINGGNISGTEYGIDNQTDRGSINVGTNDEEIKTTPVIVGEKYGAYISYGSINFYDGIIKGITDATNAEYKSVPEGYIANETEEVIDGKTYKVNTLIEQANYLKVNGVEYNSLTKAIDAIDETGTIELINNGKNTTEITIPTEKNITIDLKGYTLTTTQTITSNGSLTIDDSSVKKDGKLFTLQPITLLNINGNLIVNNGIVESSNSHAIYSGNNSSTKKITINGGEIKTTTKRETIYMSYGSFEMNGGIIKCFSFNEITIYLSQVSYEINGGSVYRTSESNNYALNLSGTGTINNLEIHSKTSGINLSSGTLIINNINIVECARTGINNSAILTINDGIIKGSVGVSNSGSSVTINGGNISGTEYGIDNHTDRGSINVGTNDEEIKTTPVIVGEKYGAYISYGSINFYDGIIKGITDAANGEYKSVPEGYIANETEEVIDGKTYKVNTLIEQANYLKVNGVEYNSLTNAIDAIDETGTIELINNGKNTAGITVPTEKNITIDLKGYTLTTTQTITSNGSLTIDDSSAKKDGKLFTLQPIHLLNINGILTVNGGIIENVNSSNSGINTIYSGNNSSTKKITINGGEIKRSDTLNSYYNNYAIYMRYGSFEMNGGTVSYSSTSMGNSINLNQVSYEIDGGIINRTNNSSRYYYAVSLSGTGVINNLEINSSCGGIGNSGKLTVNNITIVECAQTGIDNSSELTINDGIIKGSIGVNNTGSLVTINGGNISGIEYGISNGTDRGAINVGTNDEEIKTTPVIVGEKYGAYISYGSINFYDGIIKGITDASNKSYASLASSAMLITDVETINEKEYIINTLAIQKDFVKNGDKSYNNLKTAIDEANSGDTLTITSDAFVYYDITNPEDNVLTIDLNNHKLTFSVTFVNNGTLNIKDTSINKGGSIEEVKSINLINNNKTLNVDSVKLINNTSSYNYTINNVTNSSSTINNSSIEGLKAIVNYGYLEMNNSTVKSNSEEAINNNGEVVLNNTTANGVSDYAFYNNGTATIDGGSYCGKTTAIYQYSNSLLPLNNVVIGTDSNPSMISINKGNINLTSSNIYGGIYLVNNDSVLNNVISNSHFTLYNSGDYKNKIVYNSSSSILELNDNDMEMIINSYSGYSPTTIYNTGTINGSSNTVTMKDIRKDNYSDFKALQNTGTVNLDSLNITMDKGNSTYAIHNSGDDSNINLGDLEIKVSNSKEVYGIYNSGSNSKLITNKLQLNITKAENAYGLYIDGSNVTLNDSADATIDVAGTNAYGVYINGGSFTLGTKDESENSGTENSSVSITNPLIKAVGTNTGIGVRKVNGLFNYYDGKIIGSTNASPDTTSSTEPYYEVSRKTDSESGYEYAILEYMR